MTRISIFLSRAFSSMVGGHSNVGGAFSALLIEALDITSGLWSAPVGSVGLRDAWPKLRTDLFPPFRTDSVPGHE